MRGCYYKPISMLQKSPELQFGIIALLAILFAAQDSAAFVAVQVVAVAKGYRVAAVRRIAGSSL